MGPHSPDSWTVPKNFPPNPRHCDELKIHLQN